MSNNNTLDLTEITSGPVESNVQVEITDAPDDVEEPVESNVQVEITDTPDDAEEPEETESTETEETESTETEETEEIIEPVIATPDPEPEIATPDPEPVETVSPAPVEQVAADIRNILTEAPAVSTDTSELSDDLKQRIAELDYLRECCGEWVGQRRQGRSNFLIAWSNKSVTVDSNVNYEDTLNQLEKMPEIIRLWAESKVSTNSNHFKNIESYTLNKPLFNGKSLTEKVEVLEKLIDLLINCANGKMRTNKIEEVIDNLY